MQALNYLVMKKLSSFIILMVFLMNFGLIAEAKPDQVVDKIVFIHRVNTPDGLAEMAAKPSGSTKALYKWSGLHWDKTNIPYLIDDTSSGLNKAAVISTIHDSFETWDTATGEEVFADTSSSGTAGNLDRTNGVNEVCFRSLSSSGTIAVTYIWYNRLTKAIVEVDTVFNTDFTWTISQYGVPGTMDLQNIATHEFGHWLVLDDLYTRPASEQTMYGYGEYAEVKKCTLESGDIAGVQKIYGP
jgi:Matrixin